MNAKNPTISPGKNVIVVGAGIAGLICAAYLSRRGHKTLVLEQNHQPGGNMAGFKRSGYYFDAGAQSFESLGIFFPILKDLGVYDELEWTKVRFRIVSPDIDICIDSFDGVVDGFRAAFPSETGLPELFAEVRKVGSFIDRWCNAHSFPLLDEPSLGRFISLLPSLPMMRKWATHEYRRKVCALVKDPSLRHWFIEFGYSGMPFIFFAGFWNLWMKDYWHPVGGMQKLNDLLAQKIRSSGGELRYGVTVDKIDVKNGRAAGVHTARHGFLPADHVVYTGDYKALVSGILSPEVFSRRHAQKIAASKLTESVLSVYLGLDIPAVSMTKTLKTHHTFWFPDYDITFPTARSGRDLHSKMWLTANFMGAENPGFSPPGKSGLVLQTFSATGWNNHWNNESGSLERTPGYRSLKADIGRELVAQAENILPGLSGKIEHMEVGTPLSTHRFTLNSEGSSGGWSYHDKLSAVFRNPLLNMMTTPVRNVHAAGHYALWPGGVISAALSARLVANSVSGLPALSPIGT